MPERIPSVLIVDDDEDLLLVLQLTLVSNGFNVIVSVNATNLSELLAAKHPDIVMLDITMDGVDGSDICQQIKKDPVTNSVPILMFSANRNVAEIAAKCGADGYVSKPFDVTELVETLSAIIRKNSN